MPEFEPGWPCQPLFSDPPSVADRLSAPAADDLVPQILALTPRGPAWGTDEAGDGKGASPLMLLVWRAIAGWAAANYAIDYTLSIQALPSAISWSLRDWEVELGLPDSCTGPAPDLDGRLAAIRSKYAAVGGQSPNYLICLALSLGFVVTIEEFASARIGSRIGVPMYGSIRSVEAARIGARIGTRMFGASLDTPPWEYTFRVHAAATPVTYARIAFAGGMVEEPSRIGPGAGAAAIGDGLGAPRYFGPTAGARIGDRLAAWGNPLLECAIRRAKPAHTEVIFAYGDPAIGRPRLWARIGSRIGDALSTW